MKIALIEFSGSHSECLYSQIKFLQHGLYEVDVIVTPNLFDKVNNYDLEFNTLVFEIGKKGIKRFKDIFRIFKHLNNANYSKIIFNTAQGSIIRDLMLLPFKDEIELIGTVHNINKFKDSFTQKIISLKIKKYFVLNDYLIQNLENFKIIQNKNIKAYYPIFFNNTKTKSEYQSTNTIKISVPGQVEFARRDYLNLFNQIEKYGLNSNILFYFLGPSLHTHGDGKRVKEIIKDLKIENQFVLFEDFLPENKFFQLISESNYIAPLINSDENSIYRTQISGAFNLAFGLKKPLIIDESFMFYEDFKYNTILYKNNELVKVINSLKDIKINTKLIDKFTFKHQTQNYLDFINE